MTTCILGPHGGRVVRHRHTEPCAGANGSGHPCPGCQPCPEAHCQVCHRNHADTTCAACLAMARENLAVIVALTGNLSDEASTGRHAYRVHGNIPGGDALVLLGPGHHQPGPLDPEAQGDPRPPYAVLTWWAERWRILFNQPTGLAPTWGRVFDYLDGGLHILATHALFADFHRDLARTVRQLEDVLHDGIRPDRSRVPCLDCGVRLVKVYADQPDDDHWACPQCHDTYDRHRFDRAKHQHLASTGAERFVPIATAAAATGRTEHTIRSWIRRGLIDTRRHPTTGRLEAWWPDVRTSHLTLPTRSHAS